MAGRAGPAPRAGPWRRLPGVSRAADPLLRSWRTGASMVPRRTPPTTGHAGPPGRADAPHGASAGPPSLDGTGSLGTIAARAAGRTWNVTGVVPKSWASARAGSGCALVTRTVVE